MEKKELPDAEKLIERLGSEESWQDSHIHGMLWLAIEDAKDALRSYSAMVTELQQGIHRGENGEKVYLVADLKAQAEAAHKDALAVRDILLAVRTSLGPVEVDGPDTDLPAAVSKQREVITDLRERLAIAEDRNANLLSSYDAEKDRAERVEEEAKDRKGHLFAAKGLIEHYRTQLSWHQEKCKAPQCCYCDDVFKIKRWLDEHAAVNPRKESDDS